MLLFLPVWPAVCVDRRHARANYWPLRPLSVCCPLCERRRPLRPLSVCCPLCERCVPAVSGVCCCFCPCGLLCVSIEDTHVQTIGHYARCLCAAPCVSTVARCARCLCAARCVSAVCRLCERCVLLFLPVWSAACLCVFCCSVVVCLHLRSKIK